ncbi:MAG: hypothetical protein GKR93_14200 [Gammaproteobacteria bacterium]|nr:hypothetical protein [Gammaproteobacteria bacterium]
MTVNSPNFESGAISIIGILPLLAKSTSLVTAFGIGSAFVIVALLSAITISCCRRLITKDMLLPIALIVSATWVIVVDRFMHASFYELRQIYEFYIPLLAVNASLLVFMQKNAISLSPLSTLKAMSGPLSLMMSLLFMTAGLRELLAPGPLFNDVGLILQSVNGPGIGRQSGLGVFALAPGAFISLALVLAAVKIFFSQKDGATIE